MKAYAGSMTVVDRIPDIVQELREGFRNGVLRDVEAYTTEIAFTITEIDHTLKHLDDWTKPTEMKVPLTCKPGRATLRPEPLGTVCIIAPWNCPVQWLFAPLVPALAAGNTAVLKPSQVTPTVSALVEELVARYFDASTVAVVTGAVDETTALLEQRFDHIFYTGTGKVGRVVMRAAAEHLTPVTLELGGKSPAIVAADANIEVAAKRIASTTATSRSRCMRSAATTPPSNTWWPTRRRAASHPQPRGAAPGDAGSAVRSGRRERDGLVPRHDGLRDVQSSQGRPRQADASRSGADVLPALHEPQEADPAHVHVTKSRLRAGLGGTPHRKPHTNGLVLTQRSTVEHPDHRARSAGAVRIPPARRDRRSRPQPA